MKLVAGLGNPGPEYDRTRHNVGFAVVDRLARRFADPATAVPRAKFSGLLVESVIAGEKVLLLKPTLYMNRSGQSIAEAIRFYKLDPSTDLLVIVDDIALPCGLIRLRGDGGGGGHNGLGDISTRLGSSSWARCRIGIDPPGRIPQKDYVLGRFTPEQQEALEPGLEDATSAAACWVEHGISKAMNRFNRRNTPDEANDTDSKSTQVR
ncbi:MAG: aminoacyl-tRNA hydrolase [Phycisphaerales bacterium]|nr:aminoacyl-tRNA hydrolase [Phycisphaerales bacterium]